MVFGDCLEGGKRICYSCLYIFKGGFIMLSCHFVTVWDVHGGCLEKCGGSLGM